MANSITTNTVTRGKKQFQGVFNEMWTVKGTITDQDAIAIGDTASFALTVPGVALGDLCLGVSLTSDLSDGTDQAVVTAIVSAADTVTIRVNADAGEYAVDDLNSAVVKVFVARPSW